MKILWRITKIAALERSRMAGAWASLIVATILFLSIPRLIGFSIDYAISGGADEQQSTRVLVYLGAIVIGVVALRGIFNYANLYLAESVSQHVSYTIRNMLYDKLQHLSFAFHDREHTGNLMSKSTIDVEMMRMFVSMGLVRSGQITMLVIGSAVMMFLTDVELALISLSFVPVIAARAIYASTRMRKMWLQAQVEMGKLTTVLQENLAGQRVVKAFGAEEHEENKFDYQNEAVYETTYIARRAQSSNSALMQIIFWASSGVILWFGGRAVIDERITIGALAEFILYTSLLVQPMRMVGFLVNTFARAASAGQRLFEVLDAPSPVREKDDPHTLSNVHGSVSFDNVTFSYGNADAIKNVSLNVSPGQVIALMGAPGSGKTTLMSLLSRFYDVNDGAICVDGIDVREISLSSLRSNIGVVQQDVFLFSATVAENISYGHENATMDEIIQAAKTAQIHDEIVALPDGYETVIGERGVSLSGGQRQRLSIARTLAINPAILILDDSTSSVDAGTESRIQKALSEVIKGRTTFIIAHRLSSIQNAELVVVMEEGKIAEMGTPDELIVAGGLFTKVTELQYATNLNGISTTPSSVGSRGTSS
ncbi:MAG: ABC transporter [Dehalococcoidia bacterium]|nr:ABC transporter [Dehalococcoidia bacterium]|tara:strand:- start:4564 stop:6354 length:1791 start_codon:yes stop_codon:yes gene_type:complete